MIKIISIVLGGLAAIGIFIALLLFSNQLREEESSRVRLSRCEMMEIAKGLNVEFLTKGAYPASLYESAAIEVLLSKSIVCKGGLNSKGSEILDPWGHKYVFESQGTSAILFTTGGRSELLGGEANPFVLENGEIQY